MSCGCWPFVAGVLFALRSMELLMQNMGMLPVGFFEFTGPPNVMIIGIGHVGANTLNVFMRNEMNIFVVDKHPETLENRALRYIDGQIWRKNKDKLTIIKFNNEEPRETLEKIDTLIDDVDIVINCAVRRPDLPKSKMEYLITKDMVLKMKRGSVVCDTTACDKDLIETAIPSEKLLETYKINDVVHYNCDHIPSLVCNTASNLLADAVFPYAKLMANEGFEGSVQKNQALFGAVMCHQGHITHKYTCDKKNLPYENLHALLEDGT